VSRPPGPSDLNQEEIDRLTPAQERISSARPTTTLQDTDWLLVQALGEDGRAPYRQLAARTHCHESTVRRRVEELTASSLLSFDVDLAADALGFRSHALLWISVMPAKVAQVGQALADRPEVPFVAATTGSTNLVAALLCRDDRSLYEYVTGEMAALEGLIHIETAPVMRDVKMHATVTPPDS
jgi:DNA-binding Lrp family transcriptional regulator